MIYRNILFITSLTGLFLAGATSTENRFEIKNEAAFTKNAQRSLSLPDKAAEPTYQPYPYRYADPCYRQKNHDAADLCA